MNESSLFSYSIQSKDIMIFFGPVRTTGAGRRKLLGFGVQIHSAG